MPTAWRRASSRPTSCRSTANLNAQVSRGFRLGGINDPLNVPLCTPAGPRHVRRPRDVGRTRRPGTTRSASSRSVLNGNGAFNVSAFYMDIHDLQATVTAGSCSSRVDLQRAEGPQPGGRGRVRGGAEPQLRLRRLGAASTTPSCARRSPRPTRAATSASCRASRRAGGCRPCPSSRSPPRPPTSGR